MIAPFALVVVAVTSEGVPPAPVSVPPATGAAHFSALPEMWGLRALGVDDRLADLDGTVGLYLYVTERARFEGGSEHGWIYLAGGRRLIVDGELTESALDDLLRSYACVGGLEYETAGPPGDLQIAAGAYRVLGTPSIEAAGPERLRIEFRFQPDSQATRTRIRRLVCWSAAGATLPQVAGALPSFAVLARKEHPGFEDPPVDDRPLGDCELASEDAVIALAPTALLADATGRAYDAGRPLHLDAPDLVGTARPGLFTLLHEIRTGQRLAIDSTDYYEDLTPYLRDLNRRAGIRYRDPHCWP